MYVLLFIILVVTAGILLLPVIKSLINLPFNIIPQNLFDLFSKYWYLFVVVGFIEQFLFILGPILWIRIRKYGTIQSLGLKLDTFVKHFLIGFFFGLGFRFIIILPGIILGSNLIEHSKIIDSPQVNIYLNWFQFVLFVIIGPIGESILFTGFTFPPFAKKFGIKVGAIITALLFVLGHLYVFYQQINLLGFLWFFLMEITIIWLYWKRKSLFSPIGFHMAYNIIFIFLLFLNFGRISNKTPGGTTQLLFKYSQQAKWISIDSLMSSPRLDEGDAEELRQLFNVDNITAIETEILEKSNKHAKVLITLVGKSYKKIGIKPLELIFQNNKWKIIYSRSLPQSLTAENYLSEEDAYIHNNLGYIYSNYGRYLKAIDEYKIAISLEPDYIDAYWRLGCAYSALRRYDESVEVFKQAICIEPNSAKLHYNLGLAYSYLDYNSDAIKAFNQAIHIEPTYVTAYSARGYVHLRNHQYYEAIKDFHAAVELDKECGNAYIGLAIATYQSGNKKEAISHYSKAVELDKRFGDINMVEKSVRMGAFYTESELETITEILKEMAN